jgi:PTH1 family peptidyl-tRNA hydrolase
MTVAGPWLLVGLGNPTPAYEKTRHNVGFMAIDALYDKVRGGHWEKKFNGLTAPATINGHKIILLKPQTYMNESGRSVQAAMAFYKIPLAQVIVWHDDLDLDPCRVKIKQGGGHGGHNGLRSIDALCGGPNYWRVRLGIGRPVLKEFVSPYVLGPFSAAERHNVDAMLSLLAELAPLLLEGKPNDLAAQYAQNFKG